MPPDDRPRRTPEYTRWGPFSPAISHPELVCRLQVTRAFCQVYTGSDSPGCESLWRAASGELGEIEQARLEFDRLPALTGRKILSHYAEHWRYDGPKAPKRGGPN